jgi:TonB family protein
MNRLYSAQFKCPARQADQLTNLHVTRSLRPPSPHPISRGLVICESSRALVLVWLLVVIVSFGSAQDQKDGADDKTSQPDEPVYNLGPGITPPRVIKQVAPHNSMAHGVRVTGSVAIKLVVTSQGLPKEEQVIRGIEEEVDRSAVEALKQWRFAPAKKNDKPIAVRVVIEIEFHSM